MATQAGDIADIVASTLPDLGRLKVTDVRTTYQNTIAFKRIFRDKKITFDDGRAINFNLAYQTNGSFRWVGLGAADVVNIPNTLTSGTVDWRHMTWNWAIDFREPLMNRGASKIVDMIGERRRSALASTVVGCEQALWRAPASTDTTTMYGVPYWVVKSNTATTTNDGFNGTVPSGYTLVGGLNPSAAIFAGGKWSNYGAQYTSVTQDDLIRKLRRMAAYTEFEPIVDDTADYNTGEDYGHYTNYSVRGLIEEILDSRNDNLGKDIAEMDGKALFMRKPITWVKELDLDTTNPWYMLNWGVLHAIGLRGAWMKEWVDSHLAGQHVLSATFYDCTVNTVMHDRRRCGVLATNTTMGY